MFFLSIFNKKIRQGIIGRFESPYILKNYFNKNNLNFGLGYGLIAFNANTTYQRLKAHKKIYSVWSAGLNYVFVSFFSIEQ